MQRTKLSGPCIESNKIWRSAKHY